jgi:hypothetical protein
MTQQPLFGEERAVVFPVRLDGHLVERLARLHAKYSGEAIIPHLTGR